MTVYPKNKKEKIITVITDRKYSETIMSSFEAPMPLSEIEDVLSWVDGFKLSRPTKKINRDFSDAVLLAEMLSVPYPKLVEMHNYPARNAHAQKLNNWMTLNRKVLKKLKINLCCNTLEMLANSTPGVIERVLVMVRERIQRDEELNKSNKETEQQMSSGGSYYEACGDDDYVLVVPVKSRVNGVLETVQQKVVSYSAFLTLKEELKDAKEAGDVLRQKVFHLESLLKLKDERVDELQKQLERKTSKRKDIVVSQNQLMLTYNKTATITPKSSDTQISSDFLSVKNENIPKVSSTRSLDDMTSKLTVTKTVSNKSLSMRERKKSDTSVKVDNNVNDIKVTQAKSEYVFEDPDDSVQIEELDMEEFKDTVNTVENSIQKELEIKSNNTKHEDDVPYIN